MHSLSECLLATQIGRRFAAMKENSECERNDTMSMRQGILGGGILVASSCVAVLLAACSGVGTPAGGPTTGEPTIGEPPSGDGGTPGDSGGSYDSAKAEMQRVIAEITAIEGLPVATAEQKQAARARIEAAQTQYSEALRNLESAVAGLVAGSPDLEPARNYLRGITSSNFGERLTAAAARAADVWANIQGPSAFAVAPRPLNAAFERFPRAEDDGTVIPASRRLSIPTKGVMHSAGKTVFSAEGTGTTDELPMRSVTIRSAGGPGSRGDWKIQGNDGTPPTDGSNTRNTDGILNYSIQITSNGLIYKAGGNAIYYDFQRRFDVGDTADTWWGLGPDGTAGTDDDGAWSKGVDTPVNWIHDDIEVAFGQPSNADGVNAFFWRTRIPFPDGTSGTDPNIVAKISDHGYITSAPDMGAYSLWISNFGGVDRGNEYADGTPYPDDDKDRFLQYAAYGVFVYTDMLVSTRSAGRQQGFHFGYDTFADQDNLRTTDIESDDVVEATFRGVTFAVQNLNIYPQKIAANRNEIRGDITLNARIGSGANTISGEITKLEVLNDDGLWVAHKALIDPGQARPDVNRPERLVLTGTGYPENAAGIRPDNYAQYGAEIKADGSYEGGVYLQKRNAADTGWAAFVDRFYSWYTGVPHRYSTFGGTIYGPRDGDFENIETAGWWYLQPRAIDPDGNRIDNWGGIVGSFGAVRTDD